MTSSNGNIFRVIGPLWGESIGHRWIPPTSASYAELWSFLWSAPEQRAEQTRWLETPSQPLWYQCNANQDSVNIWGIGTQIYVGELDLN